MKKIIISVLLFSAFTFCACNKENNQQINTSLELDFVRAIIPIEKYANNTYAIFKNANEEELKLLIQFEDNHLERLTDAGESYVAEYITASLINENTPNQYSLYWGASINYVNESIGETNEYVFGGIHNGSNVFVPSFGINEDKSPSLCLYAEEKDILNQSYDNVYFNYPILDAQHFSEIYFSPSLGIIAFRDYDNELWSLKNFQ